jgi:transketolase
LTNRPAGFILSVFRTNRDPRYGNKCPRPAKDEAAMQNKTDAKEPERLRRIADRIRIKVIKMLAGTTGHVGGSMSIAEILACLYFREMRIDPKNPKWQDRDRFVLSKGHACPALYSALMEAGILSEDLLTQMHKMDSPLQGHPDMKMCPGIEMSTGALGQGISTAVGMAIGAKMRKQSVRVYAIVGCAECHEGQVWEAAMSAAKYKLDNLVTFIDYNKFALSETTSHVMPIDPLADKWRSFGWHAVEIDGHEVGQILGALDEARNTKSKPTAIVAHTIKAHKVSCWVGKWQCHSVTLSPEQVEQTLQEMGCPREEIASCLARMKGQQ